MKSDNELIAEFMGYEFNDSFYLVKPKLHPHIPMYCHKAKLEFHSSWDWLMPVVDKIESMGYGFHKDPFDLNVIEYLSGDERIIIAYQDDPEMRLIEKWYYVVVEFIKWHNQQNP